MTRAGNIVWIMLLLAALFFGPTFILQRTEGNNKPPDLRAIVLQEMLIDAPANIPPSSLDNAIDPR